MNLADDIRESILDELMEGQVADLATLASLVERKLAVAGTEA